MKKSLSLFVVIMKKLLVLQLVLIFAFSAIPAFAEETKEEENGSKFEQVLLKKGSLIVKEFIDCGCFKKDNYYGADHSTEWFGLTDTLAFQAASILDVETGVKAYALRITTGYYASKYNYGEAVGVMDADEIDGAIKTLQYIKQNIDKLKNYSEVVYTASSGMRVGAYRSSSDKKLFVKVNSNATKYYDISEIDNLIASFQKAKAKLGD